MSDKFEFDREEDGSLSVESAVFQALGAASTCWDKTPKGIFDSTRAKEVGDKLLEFLGHPQTSPVAGERVPGSYQSGESFEIVTEHTSETPQVQGYTETSGAGGYPKRHAAPGLHVSPGAKAYVQEMKDARYPERDSLRFGEDL